MMATASAGGKGLHDFASKLYPICRSITGNGVRKTLRLIGERIPLSLHEVPSGTKVFDWEVPLEWNIESAWIRDPDGRKVVDFAEHNLHIVSYSEPIKAVMEHDQLDVKLHSMLDRPDWIPYRTSYYRRQWGFCLAERVRRNLAPGRYEVSIRSDLSPGALSYGEFVLPGKSTEEVLFFTHVCHPSLANDNTSGMAIATELGRWLASERRRFSYRIVFAPGTIGSLCWLKKNEKRLARVRHGLVLGLLGDTAALTYKRSRRDDAEIDQIVTYVLQKQQPAGSVIPFEPYGYDERQLCSPGFDLPVGRLTRSVNDGFAEYHSSADNPSLMSPLALEQSLSACREIVNVIEEDRRYVNLCPRGEPRLGKRGLYGSMGGRSPAEREHAMLWVLNQSDGTRSLLDIARTSGIDFGAVAGAAGELTRVKLLKETRPPGPPRRSKKGVRR